MNPLPPQPLNSKFNNMQWEAIHYRGSNILVSASAGSGKTTVLIERIIQHILNGYANLDQLLVVTFTDSAAREMKERLEIKLKDLVNQSTDAEERRKYLDQIHRLPQTHVQTLHSFCLFVIQNFFHIIDIDPNLSLLTDETELSMISESVWNQLCEDIYQNKISDLSMNEFNELLEIYSNSKSDTGLYELVLDVYRFSRSHPNSNIWIEELNHIQEQFNQFESTEMFRSILLKNIQNDINLAMSLQEKLESLSKSVSEKGIEKYVPVLQADRERLDHLKKQIPNMSLELLINQMGSLTLSNWPQNRTKDEEDKFQINEMKKLRDEIKRIFETYTKYFNYTYASQTEIESNIARIIHNISKLTLLYQSRFMAIKQENNIMDYYDLEHYTLKILAPFDPETKVRVPSIAADYFQNLFVEIMVDEYQDINEIQSNILHWLSRNNHKNDSGNLFMVGDVKQSIYGFRLAEPQLFLDKYNDYQTNSENHLIILDKNYRSRNEVLQFTNFIFERIMDQNFGEMNYGQNESLKFGNLSLLPEEGHRDFNVELLLNAEDNLNQSDVFSESIDIESHIIAQKIQSLIESLFQVYDKKENRMRPIEYKDIVILSSTRKPFYSLQNILEGYKIPVLSQKVESYYQRYEIQLILSILKLIDNPIQDIPLVALLRSNFVGLTDDELALIRIHHRNHSFYEACLAYVYDDSSSDKRAIDIKSKLGNFLNQIENWRQLSMNHGMVHLILTIYEETKYLDYVLGQNNGEQRHANLHGLYRYAEQFEQMNLRGINQFIHYIESMIKREKDLSEPLLLDDNENFVRLMTVHASKGLEFPVVFLTNTGKKFNLTDSNKRYVLHKKYGMTSDLFDANRWLKYSSLIHKLSKLDLERRLKAEEMRKLYVALTRCEQKLFIVGTCKSQEQWNQLIEKVETFTDQEALVVSQNIREKTQSWLDWINQALAIKSKPQSTTNFTADDLVIQRIDINDLEQHRKITQSTSLAIENIQEELNMFTNDDNYKLDEPYQTLEMMLTHVYPFELASKTSSYQSVSELKRLFEEPQHEQMDNYTDRRSQSIIESTDQSNTIKGIRYTEDIFEAPKFMSENSHKFDYSVIGSLTHQFLQYLNFDKFTNLSEVEILDVIQIEAERLVREGYFDDQQIKQIPMEKIGKFIESEFGHFVIMHRSQLIREQAFSYRLPASSMFKQQVDDITLNQISEDFLLIHGIIDGYIVNNQKIYLFDYKTDRYHTNSSMDLDQQIQKVIDKYQVQIQLYKDAIQTQYPDYQVSAYLILLDFNEVISM